MSAGRVGIIATELATNVVRHAAGQRTVVLSRTGRRRDYDWPVSAYPGLHLRHSAVVAAVLYRDFVRRRDDATVVVACHRQ